MFRTGDPAASLVLDRSLPR